MYLRPSKTAETGAVTLFAVFVVGIRIAKKNRFHRVDIQSENENSLLKNSIFTGINP